MRADVVRGWGCAGLGAVLLLLAARAIFTPVPGHPPAPARPGAAAPNTPAPTPTPLPPAPRLVAATAPDSTATAAPTPATGRALYRQLIHEARQQYPYPDGEDRMYAVLICESGGNPQVDSPDGLNHGLFQYSAATWAGAWNPYRTASIYDARAQIFATARAWSLGMQGQWGCYGR
ncbi:MAG TPA: hypothetical protein VKY74_13005 [Chloroflexia bacterium]|nr:hypothetical protein [Chloroflexia bacterium]